MCAALGKSCGPGRHVTNDGLKKGVGNFSFSYDTTGQKSCNNQATGKGAEAPSTRHWEPEQKPWGCVPWEQETPPGFHEHF